MKTHKQDFYFLKLCVIKTCSCLLEGFSAQYRVKLLTYLPRSTIVSIQETVNEDFGVPVGLEVWLPDGIGIVSIQQLGGHRIVEGVQTEVKLGPQRAHRHRTHRPVRNDRKNKRESHVDQESTEQMYRYSA